LKARGVTKTAEAARAFNHEWLWRSTEAYVLRGETHFLDLPCERRWRLPEQAVVTEAGVKRYQPLMTKARLYAAEWEEGEDPDLRFFTVPFGWRGKLRL
jgi:hypothetical protein